MSDVSMPKDWNDAQGWEDYYAALTASETFEAYGSFMPDKLPPFVTDLLAAGWKTAWLPACGMSPLPRLLSQLGLDVHASDISPSAIAFQNNADNKVRLPTSLTDVPSSGTFTCLVHDFRQAYLENHFDIIFNVKAFQGFPLATMRQIASVHYQALKHGCSAYFDTMNVQGTQRDVLEESLVDAGFVVPFYELNRWYRQRLRETNIPHVFILGRPMVPMKGEYATDKAKWERDSAVLHDITADYMHKAQVEQERENQKRAETHRTAIIIYSTG